MLVPQQRQTGSMNQATFIENPQRPQHAKTTVTKKKLSTREARGEDDDDPMIHYGLIASSDKLMKDATIRDKLAMEEGVLWFEMEAAGLMNHFSCLIIRGICDYADSHKNKQWQGFAAMTAAAYAKELLQKILPTNIQDQKPLAKLLGGIKENLENITTSVEETNDTVNTLHADSRRVEIERWLKPPRVSTNVEKAKMRRHDGSGQWFIEGSAFQEFKAGSRQHLWLHGLAGCGKTVLSSRILDNLRDTSDTITLAHYFDFNDVKKQSLGDLLRSLAFQLYRRGGDAISSHLDQLFTSCEGDSKNLDDLELESCVSSMFKATGQVFILIDAVDECTSRKSFLPWIGRTKSASVRFILTARPEDDIRSNLSRFFGEENCLNLDKISIDGDIKSYVLAALETDPSFTEKGLSEELRAEICKKIGEGADGMFRWAVCQMDSIAECMNPNDVRKCLATLPRGLAETYDRILKRIHPDQKSESIRLLQFLVHFGRPIHLKQAVDIIATKMEHGQSRLRFDVGNRAFNPFSIVRYCPSIITVVKANHKRHTGEVHITHFSVKEYLLESDDFHPQKSAAAITQTLLAYLADIDGPSYRMPLDFPLAKYAAFYWIPSAIVAGLEKNTVGMTVEFLSNPEMLIRWHRIWHYPHNITFKHSGDFFGTTWSEAYGNWDFMPCLPPTSSLEQACANGLTEAASCLMQSPDSKVGRKEIERCLFITLAPLTGVLEFRPSMTCFKKTFKLLLETGAGINDQGWWSNILSTALHHAFSHGSVYVVRQLIQAGADVECLVKRFGIGAIAEAHDAAWNSEVFDIDHYEGQFHIGHFEVAKLLSEWPHDEAWWKVLLEWAAQFDDLDTVRALLSNKPGAYSTHGALCIACKHGHEDVVHFLLSEGTGFEYHDDIAINPETKRKFKLNCLECACEFGHTQTVRSILDHGFDMAKMLNLVELLGCILSKGNPSLMQIVFNAAIINPNTDIRVKSILVAALDSDNRQAVEDTRERLCKRFREHLERVHPEDCLDDLHAILLGGQRGALQLLLRRGADFSIGASSEPLLPMFIAAVNGHVDVVKQLIDNGADFNLCNDLLVPVVEGGHEKVLDILLDHGFDLNQRFEYTEKASFMFDRDFYFSPELISKPVQGLKRIAISMAVLSAFKQKDERRIQMLLDRKVDFNGIDTAGNTALHYASKRRFRQTVKQLLKLGANIHAVNDYGQTPLHFASLEVAQVLLQAGANINAKDNRGCTLFHVASKDGAIDMLNFLVSHGADVAARTSDGSNALHVAMGIVNANKRVVELLLDKGVNVMGIDDGQSTPLHTLCSKRGDISCATTLLRNGADINAQNGTGRTPLHNLISVTGPRCYSPNRILLLLKYGADVNIQDEQGCTALHYAQKSWEVEPILDYGAYTNVQDTNGETPLFGASLTYESATLLLERGADFNIPNNEGDTILHRGGQHDLEFLRMLLNRGADINALNNEGNSPLASALASAGHERSWVLELIAWGAKDIRGGQEQEIFLCEQD